MNESWYGIFDHTEFRCLRHLELRTTNRIFAADEYCKLLRLALKCTSRTIRTLDIGNTTTSSTVRTSGTAPGARFSSKQNSADIGAHPGLRSLTFRNLNFAHASSFNWSIFPSQPLSSLRILHCHTLNPFFETISPMLSIWNLTRVDFILLNMNMQANSEALQALEELLCYPATASLRHLRIEVPAAGRALRGETLCGHTEMESLIVGVTDGEGRWIAMDLDELRVITRSCRRLRLVGLTVPLLDMGSERVDFLNCLSGLGLSDILVIGNEEASPSAFSPAWVQYCPQSRKEKDVVDSAKLAAEQVCRSVHRGRMGGWRSGAVTVGVHLGAFYCRDWLRELNFFEGNRRAEARRVILDTMTVSAPLAYVLEG
ncbi:hypothetical protein BCR34DRAFT_583421 [Clohesyomyces aquaticus]|uniref:Uncharacterized protein n=1 Tax=Clohesyomyces aquaticus TaxID=1231657 RepID=A0A1Y2A5R8_9PLEO|nr:hypothetical protein BCR34DRAFT_583421 [Clohesyomyces aquaticus]